MQIVVYIMVMFFWMAQLLPEKDFAITPESGLSCKQEDPLAPQSHEVSALIRHALI